MEFDKGIWAAAWDVCRANIKTVVIAVAVMVAVGLLAEYLGKAGNSRTF